MRNDQAAESFVQDLQHALRNLYEPAALRKSRLLFWPALVKSGNPVAALRETLIAAIHALKPAGAAPPDSTAWRIYWILTYRYIEQTSQATVAANLGLSERQLRRQERLAEQSLADYLWDQYGPIAGLEQGLASASADEAQAADAVAEIPSREQELEWLHASLPTQSASVAEVIGAVLKLAKPLAQAAGVQIECDLAESLPPIAGQLPIARQALLNLLTAAVQLVPGGYVGVTAGVQSGGVGVHVRAAKPSVSHSRSLAGQGQAAEPLEMANQFATLLGGTLQLADQLAAGEEFAATLTLPMTEQVEVLVIDDNVDTLRLMQRYLVGTRYRFIGARDPEEALALVQSQPPRMIVLDVMMPGIDDWELLGRLRTHPQAGAAPIIVSTILPQEQLALALGAAGFMRKPVSRQTLLAVLDHQMGLSAPEAC